MGRYGEPGQVGLRWKKKDAELLPTLKRLMEGETGGDPMTGIKWTRKSSRNVSRELTREGHVVSATTVRRLLRDQGFSLRANVKRISGQRHPHRDQQFQAIQKQVKKYRRGGLPVVSVDTKKKELIGNFYNAGHTWRHNEVAVSDHDFLSDGVGKAVPYGIYDLLHNQGFVTVGQSSDTASFGVDSLSEWYRRQGRRQYPEANRLLVLADNGGCNGSVNRLWKYELQRFSDRFGIRVDVAHYPPGASKWNPIEHRLFSFISKNWAGQPLRSYETVLNYLRTTRTQTGLTVRALLMTKKYVPGVKVTDEEMRGLRLRGSRVLPRWNYSLRPNEN